MSFIRPTATIPITALDWDGTAIDVNAAQERAIIWSSPPSQYPTTFIWWVYPRDQISNRPDATRYHTAFFWGNDGTFVWGTGYESSYYGCHPFPYPLSSSSQKWEQSADAADYLGRGTNSSDSAGAPYVTNGRWHAQALTADNSFNGGLGVARKFYIDLPSVDSSNFIEHTATSFTPVTPPSPCIIAGQGPNNGSGKSWGGFDCFEEINGRLAGFTIFSSVISEAHIIAIAAKSTTQQILDYCTTNSLTPWYCNRSWKLTDITDKGPGAHHPAWRGTARPTEVTV